MRTVYLCFLMLLVALSALSAGQEATGVQDIAALRAKADAGDVKAELQLGRAYRDGRGVPQNDIQAFDWFMKAAKAGDPEAEDAVALNYRLEKNFTESLKWYGLAAKQGDANAMFNLGTHYYNGDGVQTDDVEALAWFYLAQRAGSKAATDAVTRSETQVRGDDVTDAKLRAADILADGTRVPRDTNAAVDMYEAAGESKNARTQLQIATAFVRGKGIAPDGAKAEVHCRKAMSDERFRVPAMLCLGYLTESEMLGAERVPEGITWYTKAYKSGDVLAAYGLAVAYAAGKGTRQDLEKALQYVSIAAASGLQPAVALRAEIEKRLPAEMVRKIEGKARKQQQNHTIGVDAPPGAIALGTEIPFPFVLVINHIP